MYVSAGRVGVVRENVGAHADTHSETITHTHTHTFSLFLSELGRVDNVGAQK
jgi:hypothetical protein